MEEIENIYRGKVNEFTFTVIRGLDNSIKILRNGTRGGGKLYSYHVDDFPKFLDNYGAELPDIVVQIIEEEIAINLL